jgi:hypothetical protein
MISQSRSRTADDFRRQHNTIALKIFSEGQIRFRGKDSFEANRICSNLCLIDVNGNGRYDQESVKHGVRFSEPCLSVSMTDLRRLALLKGTEILTGDDFDLKVKDFGWRTSWGGFGRTEPFEENERSADSVVQQAVPNLDPERLKWAVDVVNNDFLIYEADSRKES